MGFNFHDGKLLIQEKAGTANEAAEILAKGWIGTKISSSGDFQMGDADLKEVYLSSVDEEGRVWASAVMGHNPGFLVYADHDGKTIMTISTSNRNFVTYRGDPLGLNIQRKRAPLGMLLMGMKNQRRYRINGVIIAAESNSNALRFEVIMAMGNCPKYVHVRELVKESEMLREPHIKRSTVLSQVQQRWISSAETFVLATYTDGVNGGADASNRGGSPGFVKATDERTIVFPDYKGNNLYLSLGNIVSNPRAGLLFIQRDTGDVLQVTGEARIIWGGDHFPGMGSGPSKHVEIKVLAVIEALAANPHRMRMVEMSPFNPLLPRPSPPVTGIGGRILSTSVVGGERVDSTMHQGHLMRCTEVISVTAGIKSFRFCPVPAPASGNKEEIEWTGGQYATFFFPSGGKGAKVQSQGLFRLPPQGMGERKGGDDGGESVVVRNWTITSVGNNCGPLEITVKAKAGGVSEQLHRELRPGDLVRATVGGNFTLPSCLGAQPAREDKILLLSAGIGITPMLAAIRWLEAERGGWGTCGVVTSDLSDDSHLSPGFPDVILIHATRSMNSVPFVDQIERAASGAPSLRSSPSSRHSWLQVVVAVTATEADAEDKKRGNGGGVSIVKGRPDAEMLKSHVLDLSERHVMMCGPGSFMTTMESMLRGMGVPGSRIHSEEFYF